MICSLVVPVLAEVANNELLRYNFRSKLAGSVVRSTLILRVALVLLKRYQS